MSERAYLARCPKEEWSEWVDGRMIVLEPPNFEHADLCGFVFVLVRRFVEDRGIGSVLRGSYQVRFAELRRRRSPDLMFISNRRLRRRAKQWHFEGAPDLIVEIVSADSQTRDRREKFLEYETAGVIEYWIIDPLSRTIERYMRTRHGKYRLVPAKNGTHVSAILSGFYLKPEWLWQEERPKIGLLLRRMFETR